MDFKVVLRLILDRFHLEGVHYAVIGGFALGVLGVPRSTIDLDFLVLREDLGKIDKIMKDNGYDCAYKSENVSQYVSAVKVFGEVDFLHAFREISRKMLERAVEKDIFSGELKIRVLRAEDVIGLKLQALSNDPSRTGRDFLDIGELMSRGKGDLDWKIIQEYFSLFGLSDKFQEFKKRCG
jgi:hypothetical protein